MEIVPKLLEVGIKVIDLSADYRLKDPRLYEAYYGIHHKYPNLLEKAVYGLPELHRSEIKEANLVACPGCIAASIILALTPAIINLEIGMIISDVKIGSTGAGTIPTLATHHPERVGVVRAYKLTGHRHIAEIEQELSLFVKKKVVVHMSAHAVDIIRGILSTNYLVLNEYLEEKQVWKIYRSFYQNEPFIRVFKARKGIHRLADPKNVIGSNFCDISFELKEKKLIVLSAIDNLVKGAAGNAVQCWNIMIGIDETTGLKFPGLYPA
jgi:N-acetyl-gamma-glutamyl-phosphate/LysW-gamma-L-alpha-aminoadipyl-6-phosphate reductase